MGNPYTPVHVSPGSALVVQIQHHDTLRFANEHRAIYFNMVGNDGAAHAAGAAADHQPVRVEGKLTHRLIIENQNQLGSGHGTSIAVAPGGTYPPPLFESLSSVGLGLRFNSNKSSFSWNK